MVPIRIKSFKGHKYQEKFEAKALQTILMPNSKLIQSEFKELDSDNGQPVIRVKFASFGNIDDARDLLVKGCMGKSIAEHGANSTSNRKIAFLWQHDIRNPLGKSLLEEELSDGAYGNVRLSDFESVPDSKRLYAQLKDGTINQFSIGYFPVWDKIEYDEQLDAFINKEIRLFEYSAVTAGMNEETEFEGVLNSSNEMKSYIKALFDYQPEKYNELKTYVNQLEGAEPETPLTQSWITGFVSERLTQ